MSTTRLIWELLGVDHASDTFRKVGDQVKKTHEESSSLLATVGKYVTFGVAANQIWRMTSAASDLGEAVNLNQRLFGANAKAIEEWADTGADAFGLSKTAALTAAGQIGGALQNLGYDLDDASAASQRLIERAGDMASAFNTSVQDALFAVQAGLRGETEPLRRFNVFLAEAEVQAKALSLGLYDGKGALDAHAKAMAVEALIMEDTAQIAGDFALTSDGLANSQRRLQAHMENLRAEMGEAFLPVAEQTFGFFNNALGWVLDLNPAVGQTAVTFGMVAASASILGPKLDTLRGIFHEKGAGGLLGAFKGLIPLAAATAAAMTAMEIAEQVQSWNNLSESVDEFLDNVSRMKSSTEMTAAIELQAAAIEDLEEKTRLYNIAADQHGEAASASFRDSVAAIGEYVSAMVSGVDPTEELAQAQEELATAQALAEQQAQREAEALAEIQAQTGVTSDAAATLAETFGELTTRMEEGKSAADLFAKALETLTQEAFSQENAWVDYQAAIDDLAASIKTAHEEGITWEQVLSADSEAARGMWSSAQGLIDSIAGVALETYKQTEASHGAEAAAGAMQAKFTELYQQALPALAAEFGISTEQAALLLQSIDQYNLLEIARKYFPAESNVPETAAAAGGAIDQFNAKPTPPKRLTADGRDVKATVDTSLTWLGMHNKLVVQQKHLNADTNVPWKVAEARGPLMSWIAEYVPSKFLGTHTNAASTAAFAQQQINSVYGRDVPINVYVTGYNTAQGVLNKLAAMPRAEGGSVSPSELYVVGERGPELFVPDSPGQIIRHEDLGSLLPRMRGIGASGDGGDGYAPVVLQLDAETVWRGMVKLRRRRGQPLGLG